MNNRYTIINYTEVGKINFGEILDDSKETLRVSIDGTKCIVKWRGNEPEFLNNLETKSVGYFNSEILEILSTPNWYSAKPNEL